MADDKEKGGMKDQLSDEFNKAADTKKDDEEKDS